MLSIGMQRWGAWLVQKTLDLLKLGHTRRPGASGLIGLCASRNCAGSGATEGHAVIDAMVALLMISLTLVYGLRAVDQAENAAARAEEIRQATRLLSELMATAPRSYAASSGATDRFDWTVVTQITGAERPIEVCRRAIELRDRKSSRAYAASSLEICPESDAT